ncbi:hypothetical protein [Pseudomonas sp. RL_105y_Pfl2_101]|uniref:hypothetical protein n=1 Tax=Pseudomonas sp. RL_105y_Pfl2_101 TaxID=3088708 RepID=UPI0030DD875E
MRVRSFLIGVAFVYLVFSILSVVYGSFGYRAVAAFIGCSVLLYMTTKTDIGGLRLAQMLVFVVLVIFAFSIFSLQSTEGRSLFAVLVFLGALGICWFSIASYSTFYLYELPFYFVLGGTLILFLGFGYGPAEFNTVLSGYSRNGYSAILLAFAGGYIFSRVYRDKKISLLLLVLVLVSSFPLYGRSGIAMAFALVLAVLCHKSIKLAALFGLCGVVGVIFSLGSIEGYIYGATNFSAGIESPRSEMLEQYANALDVMGLFFGVDVGRVPIILEYGKNPHNAFILLHSYYGLAVFPLLCLFVVSLLKLFVDGRYMLLVVALLFLFRAFFDIIYLFGLFDYLLFPLLFYAIFVNYFRPELYLVSSLEERL